MPRPRKEVQDRSEVSSDDPAQPRTGRPASNDQKQISGMLAQEVCGLFREQGIRNDRGMGGSRRDHYCVLSRALWSSAARIISRSLRSARHDYRRLFVVETTTSQLPSSANLRPPTSTRRGGWADSGSRRRGQFTLAKQRS